MRLVDFPFVICRMECRPCRRRGVYRLARLAGTYGPDIELRDLRRLLTADCDAWRQVGKRFRHIVDEDCRAFFVDLAHPPRPPDLPPSLGGLKLLQGGKVGEPRRPTIVERRRLVEGGALPSEEEDAEWPSF